MERDIRGDVPQGDSRGAPVYERREPNEPLRPAWREAYVQSFSKSWNSLAAWDHAVPEDRHLSKVERRAAARELMLRDPMMRIRLRELMAERIAKIEFDAMTVVEALAEIAFLDPAEVLDFDGSTLEVRSFSDMTPGARRAISSIREKHNKKTGERTFEVRFHSKTAALASLVDVLGLKKDRERRLLGHDEGFESTGDEKMAVNKFLASIKHRRERRVRIQDLRQETLDAMEGGDDDDSS